jgi:plasmid stabilization system protein ParE
MKYVLKITPVAFSDIKNGVDYYNSQQKGLGKRFYSAIADILTRIKKMPLSASTAFDDVRYKVVDKYPYVILYKIEDNLIFIVRVFNTHQMPIG